MFGLSPSTAVSMGTHVLTISVLWQQLWILFTVFRAMHLFESWRMTRDALLPHIYDASRSRPDGSSGTHESSAGVTENCRAN